MPLKRYRCGFRPSPKPPALRFGDYFKAATLPAIPATFGHQDLVPAKGWGMLGNDQCGNCAEAGPDHLVMLWNRIAGRAVNFTATDATEDYSAITGYVPGDDATDNGTDPVQAAAYWQKTGMRDDTGARHQIVAYLQVDNTNLDHVIAAAYLFDGVGIGITMPSSTEDQFDAGEPWDVVPGDAIEDGHFVPLISRAANLGVVTWGAFQQMTLRFLTANLVEAVAYVSNESLSNGKTAEGFDLAALQSDLAALG